jgi:uncharacterized protein HemX
MSAPPPASTGSAGPQAAASAPVADTAAPPPAPETSRRARRRWRLLVLVLAVAVALAAAGGWWALRTNLDRLHEQLAEAQRQFAAAQAQAALRERDAQLRFERLESELTRLREQRGELDQLYLDLTRGRDEAALLEVERLVTLAAQELQISGSVPTALAALQGADARLARIDRPQMVALRRAIGRDIEKLRTAPAIDLTGMAVKLDQIAQGVDGWTMLSDATPQPAAPVKQSGTAGKSEAKTVPAPEPETWWTRLRAWLKQEFGDLVRIREVDTPEALLLTGAQQQLVRQQMRLRLLDARTALLMRNDKLFRADLAEAQALLARYFDTRQGATAAAQAQLKQLAGSPLSVDAPQISESLAALRGLRQGGR